MGVALAGEAVVGDAAVFCGIFGFGEVATGSPLSTCCTRLVLAWCCTLSWAKRNSSTASGSSSGLAMASLVWRAGDGVA